MRMKQRGVTEPEVEYLLKYPAMIKNGADNKRIAIGEIRNNIIKVVFIYKENNIIIITIRN